MSNPTEYKNIGPFFNGLAIAIRKDGSITIVDHHFKEVNIDHYKLDVVKDLDSEWKAREELVKIGKLIYEHEYNVTIDGNMSVRLSENELLVTPSGQHNGFLKPEDLVVVDLEGKVIRGSGRPSCEYRLHTFIYKRRPDIQAVIHVHSPYATAASLAGIDLWQTWISMAPVPTTEYARIGSADSPRVIEPFVEKYNWAILKRHGIVCWADSLWNAFLRVEGLEHFARIVMTARSTGPIEPMSPERRAELLAFWGLEEQGEKP